MTEHNVLDFVIVEKRSLRKRFLVPNDCLGNEILSGWCGLSGNSGHLKTDIFAVRRDKAR